MGAAPPPRQIKLAERPFCIRSLRRSPAAAVTCDLRRNSVIRDSLIELMSLNRRVDLAPKGRPPQPAALKLLRGNPGKRAIKDNHVKLPPSTPQPPGWLTDEIAVETWCELVPELDRLGLLSKVDCGQLASYCQLKAHLVTAEGVLKLEGLIADGQHQLVRHPMWVVAKDCRTQMLALAKELYLTPVSRLRATLPPQEDQISAAARAILD